MKEPIGCKVDIRLHSTFEFWLSGSGNWNDPRGQYTFQARYPHLNVRILEAKGIVWKSFHQGKWFPFRVGLRALAPPGPGSQLLAIEDRASGQEDEQEAIDDIRSLISSSFHFSAGRKTDDGWTTDDGRGTEDGWARVSHGRVGTCSSVSEYVDEEELEREREQARRKAWMPRA